MENYPSNKKAMPQKKEESKKVEKVITGDVVRRKKPLGKRFVETFTGGDAKTAGNHVLFDVMIPAAKDMLVDAVNQGIQQMLWGETRTTRPRVGSRPSVGHVAYNRYKPSGVGPNRDPRPSLSREARAQHNFDEIILATRAEANEVIDQLFSLISQYEVASVADFYDMCDQERTYTDEKWGWYDLRGASVARIQSGYLLDLPRPEPIRN